MTEVTRTIYGAEAARQTILKRQPFAAVSPSPALRESLQRVFGRSLSPQEAVEEILDTVAREGDAALFKYSRIIDGSELNRLRVPAEAIEAAYTNTETELKQALQISAERIRAFHQKQHIPSWMDWRNDGALGQMVRPLQRVGIYVPGGTAPLASSLLMAAIPARVAGVEEIIVCTPPQRGSDLPHPTVLAACAVCGVDAVYCIGGAQAIAALAFGTESVPKVDKIVGPGNIFVVLAKKALYGTVGIESLPGPTETLIVADDSADPFLVAADMLAQAEHDRLASAILVTPSDDLAQAVQKALAEELAQTDRASFASESLATRGGIVVCRDLAEAIALANEYAPEHLCLLTKDPWALLPQVRNAGGVFVGELASEALGDYVIGPSHIMPTGGTARYSSPVNVSDFVKITSIFAPGSAEVATISKAGAALAQAEGLTAHQRAILMRGGKDSEH